MDVEETAISSTGPKSTVKLPWSYLGPQSRENAILHRFLNPLKVISTRLWT